MEFDDERSAREKVEAELNESWFDKVRGRPVTSRPPPPNTAAIGDPLGDPTADDWFR